LGPIFSACGILRLVAAAVISGAGKA
jgi:hypothetical protein